MNYLEDVTPPNIYHYLVPISVRVVNISIIMEL